MWALLPLNRLQLTSTAGLADLRSHSRVSNCNLLNEPPRADDDTSPQRNHCTGDERYH